MTKVSTSKERVNDSSQEIDAFIQEVNDFFFIYLNSQAPYVQTKKKQVLISTNPSV